MGNLIHIFLPFLILKNVRLYSLSISRRQTKNKPNPPPHQAEACFHHLLDLLHEHYLKADNLQGYQNMVHLLVVYDMHHDDLVFQVCSTCHGITITYTQDMYIYSLDTALTKLYIYIYIYIYIVMSNI